MINKISSIVFYGFAILLISCSRASEKQSTDYSKIPHSILILYASGEPYKTLGDVEKEKADAITGPTPSGMNVDLISKRLADRLAGKYTVRRIRASEVKDYRELLQYDMLVIGNPVYFWNMHFEIKEMMDLNFEKIYLLRQDDFKKMKHVVFAMAQYGPSAENAIEQIGFGITDCSAKIDKSMVFITKMTMQHYEQQIEQLAFSADSLMQLP